MSQFKYLFSPLKIGSVTIKNRIMMPAHILRMAQGLLVSEQHIYYYAERAKGGVGLICVEAQEVHPTGLSAPTVSIAYDAKVIPRYKKLSDEVHKYGAKIFTQLSHHGIARDALAAGDPTPIWAPSAIPSYSFGTIPKEMEPEDIEEVIAGFACSARNAQEGGMDGVEIHGCHGYLISEFLSPYFNRRTDEYGGSLENRLRIVYQIVDRIREKCGRDFVLGVRISGDEFLPGGLTLPDMQEIAKRLEMTGKIDYINVSLATVDGLHLIIPPMVVPPSFAVHLAAGIRKEMEKIPIGIVCRIIDPLQAEEILANGYADIIGMVRGLICDPELPNKAKEGNLDDIRNCIGCNLGCRVPVSSGRHPSCAQNASVGREKELGIGTIMPALRKKKVLVVGGGPAGMEAARVATLEGHEVVLYEKSNQLGGQINIATKIPTRHDFGEIASFLSRQLKKLNVKIVLGTEVTLDIVLEENPDAVVVATGAIPLRDDFSYLPADPSGIPGIGQENVVTFLEVLQEEVSVGEKVLLIDNTRLYDHYQAYGTTEFLADKGKRVEVVTSLLYGAPDLLLTHDLPFLYSRFAEKGITITPSTFVKEIKGNTVILYNVFSKDVRNVNDVDTIVLAVGNRANNALYKALKNKVSELYAIGDCLSPRGVVVAIYEGNTVARKL